MKPLRILLTAVFVALGPIASVTAHTELLSSSPTEGTTLRVGQPIELTFSEAPLLAGSSISLVDQDGQQIQTTTPHLNGTVMSIDWPEAVTAGPLDVNWRAVADDGHVVSGSFTIYYEPTADVTPIAEASTIEIEAVPTSDRDLATKPAPNHSGAQRSATLAFVFILLTAIIMPRFLPKQ